MVVYVVCLGNSPLIYTARYSREACIESFLASKIGSTDEGKDWGEYERTTYSVQTGNLVLDPIDRQWKTGERTRDR